jgi:glycine C-acetyltransferase
VQKSISTEEVTSAKVDIHIATLGKALGVNGGYVVSSETVINYLRETAPFYIYSNPITPSEAAAAIKSLDILDSPRGLKLLEKLRTLTRKLEEGLKDLGYETIPGEHPIVPLMIRDTEKTSRLVKHLFENGILATGLNFPVVPKGDEEIRFQVSANHTEKDIDYLLGVLKSS